MRLIFVACTLPGLAVSPSSAEFRRGGGASIKETTATRKSMGGRTPRTKPAG